ncbi:hypothetical protein QLQ12_23010 [Actinoplanes sp. NEAU-A12]|uniref:Uncharacterized protein n=1 Tax=Actinoplanes sandaracinus TaxID=3045177 RepID=A0ABT6WP53_9ACTN|nr:hypothetical protein [Actinoplanes sandaracinus]MDI6101493.1 hypothetical protein [Actinoplanes sandaracinus]
MRSGALFDVGRDPVGTTCPHVVPRWEAVRSSSAAVLDGVTGSAITRLG